MKKNLSKSKKLESENSFSRKKTLVASAKGLRELGLIPSAQDLQLKQLGKPSELLGLANNTPNA